MIHYKKYFFQNESMSPEEYLSLILDYATKMQYSDIHLSSGSFPMMRDLRGEMVSLEQIESPSGEPVSCPRFSWAEVETLIRSILSADKYLDYKDHLEVDSSYSKDGNIRYRVNCFTGINGKAIALRQIPTDIPSMASLGLSQAVKDMCDRQKWLILMTGPTGSGKSTNLAAMIDYINETQKKHIISIEDPIEFVYRNKASLIHQREVGIHTKSFAAAMRSCLREDPDVILVWEMRDPETIRAAITLAETWHLVFSTLHTNDTVQTIDRIIDVFPEGQQEQIRMQLSMSLVGVVAQRLLPRSDKEGRIAAREILLSNDAVRNLIMRGDSHQLYSVIEIGQKQGMILMDSYLVALYKKWFISEETLKSYARDKENITSLL